MANFTYCFFWWLVPLGVYFLAAVICTFVYWLIMRDKYATRQILLSAGMQKDTAIQLIKNCPLDPLKPLEFILREHVKPRKPDQNSLMWAGPLKDIAAQAWVDGRRYSAETWHEFLKREYLPENAGTGTKESYIKWDVTPSGERVLIGSTTDLTVSGFSDYLEQVYAYGASLGVQFTTNRIELFQ